MKARRQSVDELEFDGLVAEIQRLRNAAVLERRSAAPEPVRTVSRADHAQPKADPLFLPICGPDLQIVVGETVAVLHLKTMVEGRSTLIPIAIDALGTLAYAVADALRTSIDNQALKGF